MAVTSSTSAELIAVSSLLTFDVYKTYYRPNTDSETLVRVSHWSIVLFSLVLSVFCCVLNAVGVSLTWLLTVLGVIVGGASVPVGFILLWDRMSTVAAIAAPWIGLCSGLISWLITSWKRSGTISIETTGDVTNAVAGNITSFGVGVVSAMLLSLIFLTKYMSTNPEHIECSNTIIRIWIAAQSEANAGSSETTNNQGEQSGDRSKPQPCPSANKALPQPAPGSRNKIVEYLESKQIEPLDPILAKTAEKLAQGTNLVFLLITVILVPFTLFGTQYIYSRSFFAGWAIVSLIWVWVSILICVIYPVVESAGALREILAGLWMDTMALLGKKKVLTAQVV